MFHLKVEIAYILFLFFGIRLITSIPLNVKQDIDNTQYSILFDGGSKGTRMYIYSFKLNTTQRKANSVEQKIYCELQDDGLSTYKSPSEIAPKFKSCMDEAAKIIPLEKRKDTYIGLFATAGMRLLEIKNKPLSDQLINGIRLFFQESGYLFTNPNQVQILPGKEEGVYAWIGANFAVNTFENDNFDTLSIIDLGGSSSQIAFEVSEDYPVLNKENIVEVKINNRVYNVYSYSHLCFGTASFLNMYNTFTLRSENYVDPVKPSCQPTGYNIKTLGADFLDQPCVNGMMFNFQDYPFTLDTNLVKPTKNYDFNGNSKKNKCRDEVNSIIPESNCKYGTNQCSLNGVYMPPVSPSKFLALGNFFEAIDYTEKLLNISVQHDMNSFNEATYTICSMSYTQLMDLNKLNNANVGKNRIARLCLEHVYILKLLDYYKIYTLANVEALEQVNGNKISWILGFLINELNSENGIFY